MKEFSKEAVSVFVRFFYGYELDVDGELSIAKELITMGGMYGMESLQEAAADIIKQLLTEDNVIEILQFSKNQQCETAIAFCVEFIGDNFDREELQENGIIKEHPEIALHLLDIGDKFKCMARPYENEHSANFDIESKDEVKGITTAVTFSVDKTIMITGVGVSWIPTNNANIQVDICKGNDIMFTHSRKYNDYKSTRISADSFQETSQS